MEKIDKNKFVKIVTILTLGNALEYYDFLLFAHMGSLITPLFFPHLSALQTHILSLLLFGISFVIRPIGGIIFGRIADTKGRKKALIESIKWAIIPSVSFAFLPTYETLGVVACFFFVTLRVFQGFALGGEYPIAGIYLMEMAKKNHGFYSGILVASGTVGSLLGLGCAIFCIQEFAPTWAWRIAFLLGGFGGVISYYMRKNLPDFKIVLEKKQIKKSKNLLLKGILVFLTSVLASSTMWIPATYSNFYVTKILFLPVENGLYASLICLVTCLFAFPISGLLYDRVSSFKYFTYVSILICPLTIISIYLLGEGYIMIAQIGLVASATLIGAPMHKFVHDMFPPEKRGRNIGFIFMGGLSLGGILPSISSYIVSKTDFHLAPAFLISIIALIVYVSFVKLYDKAMVD